MYIFILLERILFVFIDKTKQLNNDFVNPIKKRNSKSNVQPYDVEKKWAQTLNNT